METNMHTTRLWFLMAMMLTGVASKVAAQQPLFSAPKDYVLALGDSLTFGYQQAKFLTNPDPSNFTTGFVDDFARRLTATSPGRDSRVVNFGCPGETTYSFLIGCRYHATFGFFLHDNFDGSQIEASEAFLAAHPGQVGPILISLGANDILALVIACGGPNPQCISANLPNILARLATNYRRILARLRTAAPDAEIIAVALYNPYAVFDAQTNAQTNGLTAIINQVIEAVAAANRVRVANPFLAFDFTPPQPATLCYLTLFCGAGDVHPSDPGYQVLADAVWTASDYVRFEH
jgi:lysophospholipase L1-like esterase